MSAATSGIALTAVPNAAAQVARTGGPRLKLGLCAYSYRDYLTGKSKPKLTLMEFLDHAARLPLDGVELTEYYFPKPVTSEYVVELKRKCYLLGLGITGSPMATNLTHPVGPNREKEIQRIKEWVTVAELLGAPTIRIFAGTPQPNQSQEDARKMVIQSIEEACSIAGKSGVILALENHHGVTDNAQQVLEIVKGVQSPWFGLNLDFGNFNTADPYLDLRLCAPYAVTTHMKTEIRPNNGPKVLSDLKKAIGILKEANYRGYVNLEYEASEEPLKAVPRILNELHGLL